MDENGMERLVEAANLLPNPAQLRAMARPDADPLPCMPGRHCERRSRDLGACIAGECNPPRAVVPDGVAATPECVCDNGHRPTNNECPVNANGPTFGVNPYAPAQHYPVEWGPSDARRLTCACGNADPAHMDGVRVDREGQQ